MCHMVHQRSGQFSRLSINIILGIHLGNVQTDQFSRADNRFQTFQNHIRAKTHGRSSTDSRGVGRREPIQVDGHINVVHIFGEGIDPGCDFFQ